MTTRQATMKNNGITTSRKLPVTPSAREWVELIDLTPEMAAHWLEEYHFDGQRRLKPTQVNILAAEMRAGRFKRSEFRMGHVNNQVMLSNGQHRLHAVVQSGVTIPATVYHFVGDGRADVADDYTYCDINSLRTLAERVQATDLLERTGMTYQNFNAFCAALGPIIGGFSGSSYGASMQILKSSAIRQKAIEDYYTVANEYFDLIYDCDGYLVRTLRRKPVIAVAIATLAESPATGAEFWQGVAENDGLRKGDPRHAMIRWLLSNKGQTRNYSLCSRIVAQSWNAFYARKTLHRFNMSNAVSPIYIAGTKHYDGKNIYLPYGEEG